MSRNLYELLGIEPGASADEIKRAFRREIAKYHPDKVQHLGEEFQQIAAARSAELTRAYTTLSDEAARAEYDEGRAADVVAPTRPSSPKAPAETARTAAPPPPAPRPAPGASGGASDLVRKAAIVRFRQAMNQEFGRCEDAPIAGFEIACAPPKGYLWSKVPPRIFARFVPQVDAAAISETWKLALRAQRDDQRDIFIFVMGPVVAPVTELARAIADAMRRHIGAAKMSVVPVNTRTWSADIPKDAPPVVKALATRLKSL